MLLTSNDLQVIAEALAVVESDERITENPIFGRIEVIRPDSNPDDVCGYFSREGTPGTHDTWYGFEQVSA